MRTTSRPSPSKASDTAVVRIIAMVMVKLRRRPVRTSLRTKLARIGGVGPRGIGGKWSATDAVNASGVVAHDPAEVELDHAAAHRVDDRVVMGGHQHRGAGAV